MIRPNLGILPAWLTVFILLPLSKLAGQEATGDKTVVFGRDIAPLLVANCLECHDDARKRGGLSIATPEKLMAGGDSGVVIQPGKPNESLLVRHIKGEEQPRMPNGRRPLSDKSIAIIAAWVAAGARLDEGQNATATTTSLAWSPERLARDRLSRLSATERLAAEKEELARAMAGVRPWQAPDDAKTIEADEHFAVIGIEDASLRKSILADLNKSRARLIETMNIPAGHPLQSDGRILLFLFQKPAEFVEFKRQNGFESTDSAESVTGRLTGAWPILAVQAGPESFQKQSAGNANAAPKKSRSKTGKKNSVTDSVKSVRSLNALAVESLAIAVLDSFPKAPAWLKTGLASHISREFDQDEFYYTALKTKSREVGPGKPSGDWDQRSGLFLKDQLPEQVSQPFSFSLIDWLATTQPKRFAEFAREIANGGESALDGSLAKYWNIDRQGFLAQWTAAMLRSSTSNRKGR